MKQKVAPPTNLVNFLVKAYEMPTDICAKIVETTDSLEERNIITYLSVFAAYISNEEKKTILPEDITSEACDKHHDGFLANGLKIAAFKKII